MKTCQEIGDDDIGGSLSTKSPSCRHSKSYTMGQALIQVLVRQQ